MNGLLSDNPWTQIGMGLLSANAPSLTPQNPMQHIQQQMLLGNQMQRQKKTDDMQQLQYNMSLEKWEYEKKKREQQAAMLAAMTGTPPYSQDSQSSYGPDPGNNYSQMPYNGQEIDPSVMPDNGNSANMIGVDGYQGAVKNRLSQIDRMIPLSPDITTYNALTKERMGLLESLDKIASESDYSNVQVDNQTGRPYGEHNRRNRLEWMDTGEPVTNFNPQDVMSREAYNQNISKKKAETVISQSGYRTKKINVNGIDYEQEIYTDVDGNQHVTNSRPVVEPGFKVNSEDGGGPDVVPQTGGTRDMNNPKNWTEQMRLAAGYVDRMVMAEKNINSVLNDDANYNPASKSNYMYANGQRLIANQFMSKEDQRYMQSASDWIRAKLRKESGAVIADEEMASEYATYFPIPGDSKEVIEQKREARIQATRNMQNASGEAWKPDQSSGIPQPKTENDFNQIRRGELYIDTDGRIYRKK